MTWNNTWWKHALYMAGLTLASNLILRVIFWSDKQLLSWNVPLSLIFGFAVGWATWPIQRSFLAQHRKWRELESNHRKVVRLIDDFLANPDTGVHRDRPARRTEPKGVHDTEEGL